MQVKHKYNSIYGRIATPHVEPHINIIRIHLKLPFLAKTHKFLSRINNWLYDMWAVQTLFER